MEFSPLKDLKSREALHFGVALSVGCPMYSTHDEFEVDGNRVMPSQGKPTCLVLAADIADTLGLRSKLGPGELQWPLRIDCSGCQGSLSLTGSRIDDLLGSLSAEQRKRVESLLDALGHFSLFKSLGEQELRKVIPDMMAGDFEPGSVIVKQGDPGTRLYVIEKGAVEVLSGARNQTLITTLRQGEIFGEMSLLTGGSCSATIRVSEPSRLLAIDGDVFTRMVLRYPSIQAYLFRLLSHRLRETNAVKESQSPNGIRGSTIDIGFVELLQTLHMTRKDGVLRLTRAEGSAEIVFANGEITSAEHGSRTGTEALYGLLGCDDGTFVFTPGLEGKGARRTPIGDFMGLLMEGLVRLDQSRPGAPPLPHTGSGQSI